MEKHSWEHDCVAIMKSNGYDEDAEEKSNSRKEKKERRCARSAEIAAYSAIVSINGPSSRIVTKERMRESERILIRY